MLVAVFFAAHVVLLLAVCLLADKNVVCYMLVAMRHIPFMHGKNTAKIKAFSFFNSDSETERKTERDRERARARKESNTEKGVHRIRS